MPHPRPREARRLRRVHVQMAVVHEDVRSQGVNDERHPPRVVQQLEERAIPSAERQEVQGSVFILAFGSTDPIDGGGESSDLVRGEGALDEHVPVALERRSQVCSFVLPDTVVRHVSGDRGRQLAVPRSVGDVDAL